MSVMATYCQICGMPVHWDHYVPRSNGLLAIFRGGRAETSLVPFGPEHEWLKRAVGVRTCDDQEPEIVRGEVHDGGFEHEDGFTGTGVEDRAALHEVCWNFAERPDAWDRSEEPFPEFQAYRRPLFDFATFLRDGHGWLLSDPRSAAGRRARQRLLKRT